MQLIDGRDAVTTGPLGAEQAVSLLHGHWSSLHGLAVGVLRDGHAAQDVVQDVLVAVIRLRPVFDDEDAALRYARTAVLNQCRSVVRRQGTVHRYLRLVRHEEVAPPADGPTLRDEADRRVLALFDTLPLRQREVLTLRFLHDLTDREISETLGISTGTVRSTASRALDRLSTTTERTTP